MKKQHVDDWFKYLNKNKFRDDDAKQMTLKQLAAKMSKGVGDGKRG